MQLYDLLQHTAANFYQMISWSLILLGTTTTCITWAIFENGGSHDKALAKGIIAAMFFVGLGYGGPANTFMATVRLLSRLFE
jgi:hypothetical protein